LLCKETNAAAHDEAIFFQDVQSLLKLKMCAIINGNTTIITSQFDAPLGEYYMLQFAIEKDKKDLIIRYKNYKIENNTMNCAHIICTMLDYFVRRIELIHQQNKSNIKDQVLEINKIITQFMKNLDAGGNSFGFGFYLSSLFGGSHSQLASIRYYKEILFQYTFSNFWKDPICLKLLLENKNFNPEAVAATIEIVEEMKQIKPAFGNVNFIKIFFYSDSNLQSFLNNILRIFKNESLAIKDFSLNLKPQLSAWQSKLPEGYRWFIDNLLHEIGMNELRQKASQRQS
jgi:hypothetical protein